MFNRADFSRLAEVNAQPAITIYMPTHRAGQETQNGHDRIAFKDAIKEVRNQLETRGTLDKRKIDEISKSLDALDQDANFWRHQSDTLAVFLADGKLETYTLPLTTKDRMVFVGDQFQLAPAAGMLSPEVRYYIFTMAMGSNAFYEATRHSITSIYIADHVPVDMEEVLEVYDGSESLQWHSTGTKGTGAIFHGQGSNEDRIDERKEIYYKRVSNGLETLLAGQEEPLVVVCDSQHFTEFKASFKYPHIWPQNVDIDPSNLSPAELHTETWQLIKSHFDKTATKLTDQYSAAVGAKQALGSLYDAAPAAMGGRVATLFMDKAYGPVYGEYDGAKHSVKFHDSRQDDSIDLVEFALRQTVANGGKVVVRDKSELPNGIDGVGASLRY